MADETLETIKTVGDAIRALRRSRNLTLLELANAADTDPGNLSRLERGKQGASDEMLKSIADALDVKVSTIYAMLEADPKQASVIIRAYNKELAQLEEIYLKLNGQKRKQALRILKALTEE